MSEQPNPTTLEKRQKLAGLWAAGVFAALSMALAAISIYAVVVVQQGNFQVEDTVLMPTAIALVVVSLWSFFLIRRGRYQAGTELLFFAMMILPVIAALMINNFEGIVALYLAVFAPLMFARVLPKASRWRAVITVFLVVLAIVGIEIWNPAFRGSAEFAAGIVPIVTALAAASLLIFLISQSWEAVARSLRLKITVWTGIIIAVMSITLIVYSAIAARQTALENAQSEALSYAASQAYLVRTDIEVQLNTARALAQSLAATKDPQNARMNLNRDQVNAMLRQVLVENTNFLGVDTLWEPNAFDGQDDLYRNAAGHDETGRFIPYWVRSDDGSIGLVPLVDYETPGLGDWYILPRLLKNEVVLAPLVYPINGVDTVMASCVVPVMYEDKFYGIVGIDAPIEYVQQVVDSTSLYEGKAEAFLMNHTGTIIGFQNRPELVNQHITKVIPDYFYSSQADVVAGKTFTAISPDGQYLRVFVPLKLGETKTYWFFGMLIPFSEITAAATASAIRQATIGALLTLLSLILLWILTGQIVKPLRVLTTTANEVSQGRMDTTANVQTVDETGVLANAFNLMITQLRELVGSLEQRVAERTQALATVAEVSVAAAAILESEKLLQEVVDLTKERFHLYQSLIYLADDAGENLALAAAGGEAGRAIVTRGDSIPMNHEKSVIARAARERRGVLISDAAQEPNFMPDPLMPDTRSELAVPLIAGGNLLGVFDIQSERTNRFTEADINVQSTLAAQVSNFIQNTRSFEQSKAQAELESLINIVSQKIQRTTRVDETLQTAIQEVSSALGGARVSAVIGKHEDD